MSFPIKCVAMSPELTILLSSFWCAVWSTAAAGTVTMLLLFHYVIRFGLLAYHNHLEALRVVERQTYNL